MRYEEPELRILLMNVENVIRTSPESGWIEDGTDLPTVPGTDGDNGSYDN